jgi:hypothetical protein
MDIKAFGLTVDASGALKAIRDTGDASAKMAQDGAHAAQQYADAFREKLNRVAREYIPETMRAIDSLAEHNRVLATSNPGAGLLTSAEVARGVAGYEALIAAQKGVEVAAVGAGAGLGRIRQGLTSLVAQMTGTIPVLDRIVSSMGGMALGTGVIVGVLAALAAVAAAYRFLTSDARAAAKAQDEALQKMVEWDKKRHVGAAGEFGENLAGGGQALVRETTTRSAVARAGSVFGGGIGALADLWLDHTKTSYAANAQAIREGGAVLGEETTRTFLEQRGREAATLAENIKSNNATHAERLRAVELLKQDRTLMAQYKGAGVSGDLRSALGSQIEGLDSALNPDVKKIRADPSIARAAKEEDRTKAMIAALDEEAAASDRMLAARRRGTDAAAKQEVEETVRLQLAQTGLAVGTARYAQVERDIRQTIDNTAAVKDLNDADKEREKADKARDVAAKKANDEAIAEQKKQMQAVDSLFKSSFTTLFTDITSKGKNAFASLFDAIRTGFIKLLADMAATQLTNRVMGGALGMMLGGVLTPGRAGAQGSSGPAVPWGALGDGDVATSSRFSTAAGYAGIALGGLGVGYGIGGAAHSATMAGLGGALGGAGSGAMIGAAFGSALGPHGAAIGAALGGLTGLVGGLLGFGSAAKEAARQMKEAQTVLALSMASLRADVNHDVLGGGIARVNEERETRRKAIEDAFPGGGSGSEQVAKRNAMLADMNALEDKRIALLQIEYAQSQKHDIEDLKVRKLRAEGHLYEADAMAFAEQQAKELEAAQNSGKDAAYMMLFAETQLAEKRAHQADVMQAAVRNAPSGFKVSGYGYDFATPAAAGGQLAPTAQTPPVIFNFGQGSISVDGSTDPEKVLSAFVIGLRRRAASTVGTNMPLSSALDRIQ